MSDRTEFVKALVSELTSIPSTTISDPVAEGSKVLARYKVRFANFNSNKNNATSEQVVFVAAEDAFSGPLLLRGGVITSDLAVTGSDTAYTTINVGTRYANGAALATWASFNVKLTGTGSTGNIAQFARVNIPSAAINTALATVPVGGTVTIKAAVTSDGGSTANCAVELVLEAT